MRKLLKDLKAKATFILILFLSTPISISAQTGGTGVSSVIASKIQRASTLPAVCSPGDVRFLTTPTVGTYQCISANTWVSMGSGGGGGSPGSPNHSIQFNSGGTFTGSSTLLYDPAASPQLLLTATGGQEGLVTAESGSGSPILVGGFNAITTIQTKDQNTYWNLAYTDANSPSNWANFMSDDGSLNFNNYDLANAIQGEIIFLQAGTISLFTTNGGAYYFTKSSGVSNGGSLIQTATSEFHLAFGVSDDPSTHTKVLTWTDVGVGVNNPLESTIAAQLHVISASASRVGFKVDSAASPSVALATFTNNGTTKTTLQNDGSITQAGVTFANLGTPANGTIQYCSDCKPTTVNTNNTCTSGGNGNIAFRLNGVWRCFGDATQ